jgi:hypothetical protein
MIFNISSFLAFIVYPLLILSAIIPFSRGSLFDFVVLPAISLYSLARLLPALSSLSIKRPIFAYVGILLLVLFVRFSEANDSDFLIASIGLRLLMPVSFLVAFIDLFNYICKLNERRKEQVIGALLASYLLSMIGIMIFSFRNGIGSLGLGLAFPLYTEGQIDRHVYGPAVSSLAIFCCLGLFLAGRNIFSRQLSVLMLISAFFGLLSSVASGSRSPFLMYATVIAYILIMQIYKSRFASLLKTALLSSVVLFITFLLKDFESEYADLINRALGVFQALLDPASDISRSVVYEDMSFHFLNSGNWLVGASNIIGAADSGVLNLFLNGGFPLLVSFLAVWIATLLALPYSSLKIFLIAVLVQFLVGSETFFIPRYFLTVSLPAFFLALSVLGHSLSPRLGLRPAD